MRDSRKSIVFGLMTNNIWQIKNLAMFTCSLSQASEKTGKTGLSKRKILTPKVTKIISLDYAQTYRRNK